MAGRDVLDGRGAFPPDLLGVEADIKRSEVLEQGGCVFGCADLDHDIQLAPGRSGDGLQDPDFVSLGVDLGEVCAGGERCEGANRHGEALERPIGVGFGAREVAACRIADHTYELHLPVGIGDGGALGRHGLDGVAVKVGPQQIEMNGIGLERRNAEARSCHQYGMKSKVGADIERAAIERPVGPVEGKDQQLVQAEQIHRVDCAHAAIGQVDRAERAEPGRPAVFPCEGRVAEMLDQQRLEGGVGGP